MISDYTSAYPVPQIHNTNQGGFSNVIDCGMSIRQVVTMHFMSALLSNQNYLPHTYDKLMHSANTAAESFMRLGPNR